MPDPHVPDHPPHDPPDPDADRALELADYEPGAAAVLSDAERWPALSPAGAARLGALRTHPRAPAWVHTCGDRLTAADVAELAGWTPADLAPGWTEELTARLRRTVPHHRRHPAASFAEVVPTGRADLARRVADFVPDDAPLDRLFQGTSSGSTGSALVLPLEPVSTAAEVRLLHHLLARRGVDWAADPARLGLAAVLDQRRAFTYASVVQALDEALMARVNLDPGAWRAPGDREAFLAGHDPQVVTGPATALLAYARLEADLHPLALVPGALHLTPAARAELDARFGVPVLDLYGLKETGPVAVSDDGGPHRVLPRRLHVECLRPDGTPAPDGERGEVVVTVDENPLLPLLRYRTGDHARLERRADGGTWLHGLEGRAPVRFARADGGWTPSVDLTQLLQHHGALGWQVHQHADGSVVAGLQGGDPGAVRAALQALLGVPVEVRETEPGEGGPRRWSSAVPGAVT